MSAQSGGLGLVSERVSGRQPVNVVEAANAAKRQLVPRKRDVELTFAQPVTAEALVDAVLASVKPQQLLEGIQQINSKKFLVTFKSSTAAEYFSRELVAKISVAGLAPVCRWLGVERKRLRVSFLPCVVPNAELASVLNEFGRVLQIIDEVYSDRPISIKTGTRIVDMEMASAVPNIITVCGFSVPVTYKGVEIQCRRCLRHGHLRAECTTLFCDRCRSFGHDSSACSAPCLKCKAADHHWKDCSVRSYAFAATALDTDEAAVVIAKVPAESALSSVAQPLVELESEQTLSASEASSDPVAAPAVFDPESMATVLKSTTTATEATDVTCQEAAAAHCENIACSSAASLSVSSRVHASGDCARHDTVGTNVTLAPVIANPKENYTSSGMTDLLNDVGQESKITTNSLEWKTALTRSKRKLAAPTPGRAPSAKKSTT